MCMMCSLCLSLETSPSGGPIPSVPKLPSRLVAVDARGAGAPWRWTFMHFHAHPSRFRKMPRGRLTNVVDCGIAPM